MICVIIKECVKLRQICWYKIYNCEFEVSNNFSSMYLPEIEIKRICLINHQSVIEKYREVLTGLGKLPN